jgi:exodeoxyribonuclease VII small subunit
VSSLEERGEMMAELTFEQAMERLEQVVSQFALEEAIQLYGEGAKLAAFCRKKLDWAEQQVEIVVEENGDWLQKEWNVET